MHESKRMFVPDVNKLFAGVWDIALKRIGQTWGHSGLKNLISSYLNPTDNLCQIWGNSFEWGIPEILHSQQELGEHEVTMICS